MILRTLTASSIRKQLEDFFVWKQRQAMHKSTYTFFFVTGAGTRFFKGTALEE